jgi:hypothetical protein
MQWPVASGCAACNSPGFTLEVIILTKKSMATLPQLSLVSKPYAAFPYCVPYCVVTRGSLC